MDESPVPDAVRQRLCLVLDLDDGDEAVRLATRLRPWFGVVKTGYQLVYSAGSDVVRRLVDEGFDVFVDLKLHDIPNTCLLYTSDAADE